MLQQIQFDRSSAAFCSTVCELCIRHHRLRLTVVRVLDALNKEDKKMQKTVSQPLRRLEFYEIETVSGGTIIVDPLPVYIVPFRASFGDLFGSPINDAVRDAVNALNASEGFPFRVDADGNILPDPFYNPDFTAPNYLPQPQQLSAILANRNGGPVHEF